MACIYGGKAEEDEANPDKSTPFAGVGETVLTVDGDEPHIPIEILRASVTSSLNRRGRVSGLRPFFHPAGPHPSSRGQCARPKADP
jgi:hypothetical protein